MKDIIEYNKEHYEFFWSGPFSQWYMSNFTHSGITYNCAEQWMMYWKAKIFGDLEIADRILNTTSPKEQKSLGRKVRNFDADHWDRISQTIVYQGNEHKFTQNKPLLHTLLKTRGKILVEASPYDKIWGIGLSEKQALQTPRSLWKGENRLGMVLTNLREILLEEDLDI